MTRIAHLQPYLNDSELKNRYWQATAPVEARRWHLLWLISLKRTIKEASMAVGMNYDYARELFKLYNKQGEKGIIRKQIQRKERSKRALLNEELLSELSLSLKEESPDKGIWTGPKVAEWIAKKTGREQVWAQRGWDYLKQCGYSCPIPDLDI